MMKVLLCERSVDGHHKIYMEWLSKIPDIECYVLAPENVGVPIARFTQCAHCEDSKSMASYLEWVRQIRCVVKNNGIDVIHILDGDSIMRYFGLGFTSLGTKRIVITYHHFFPGMARKISYRMMCRGKTRSCVAHTESVHSALKAVGVKNVDKCEYPCFHFDRFASREPEKCKKRFGVPSDVPVIGIVGGMSPYKNMIPFLKTMQNCEENFHILICGKESGVKKEEIAEAVAPYADRVTANIRLLDQEEYEDAIVASDIIYCIYGHEFDGASGPLTDGVCAEKFILACKHGSLGEITSQNCLGLTAECEDSAQVLDQTVSALKQVKGFTYCEKAKRYREGLNPQVFQSVYWEIYNRC